MAKQRSVQDQHRLISALARALAAEAGSVQTFETHISWVLVADAHAYKIKKAVQFDFLDFSTLGARRHYCQEELRLNARLAPGLYLDVVPVTGPEDDPRFGGSGAAIEYAVKMQAFPQQALWSERLISGGLTEADIDKLGQMLSNFHHHAPAAAADSLWGSPAVLQKIAAENLGLIQAHASSVAEKIAVKVLLDWQASQNSLLPATFVQRKVGNAVKECHGDLHLGNVVTLDSRVLVFDCIEFSERLRWTDVMNDIGFICMDLTVHGQRAAAARLLSTYLEATGDYSGIAALRYYQIPGALVRWQIALLNSQPTAAARNQAAAIKNRAWAARYMTFAVESIGPGATAVVIMHGYSGSGKSTVAGHLVELFHGVRIRSDVERKRMHGLAASATAPCRAGLYNSENTDATCARLAMLASQVVRAGYPAIVDATFLLRKQRRQFEALAGALGVPYFIVAIHGRDAVLQARLAARAVQEPGPSDADVAVLAHQHAVHEALSPDEQAHAIIIDSHAGLAVAAIRAACAPIADVLAASVDQWKGEDAKR